MTRPVWIAPDLIFDGDRLIRGAICLAEGRVASVSAKAPGECRPVPGILTPGYVDLQVNGGGGVLFNSSPTRAGLEAIAAAHRRFGTVAIFPTVITDAPEVLGQAVEAVLSAREIRGIAGLHIEGPHIAEARRGTHAARFVRPMEAETLAYVKRLRKAGVAVMITLAPEAATAEDIAALAGTGAVVSIGHSDATAEETRAALAAGARCFTHLFNAMSPMLNRAPGVTGAAINSTAHAGLICDGHHVADEMVSLALRARPGADTTFLVSDAMPTVGGADRFSLYGETIRVVDGALVNEEGSLAGAHVTMAAGVARLCSHVGLSLEQALRMAISVPARLIGQPQLAGLEGRRADDLLILRERDLGVQGTLADQMPAVV